MMTADRNDTFSPDVFHELGHHATFARLRADDPVHWAVGSEGHGFWSLTKHADVRWANRDPETFTGTRGFTLVDVEGDSPQSALLKELLPGMETDRHAEFRRIVSRGFTPKTLRAIEDHLAFKAKVIVDHVIDRGAAEFVEDIAAPLPLQAICELIGVPEGDRRRMFELGNNLTRIVGANPDDMNAGIEAASEMMAYADGLRTARQDAPQDDIATTLTRAVAGDRGLNQVELGMFFILLVVAGNETTRNATAQGMRALLEHPDQLTKLQADPSSERMKRAVEEMLRWAPPVLNFRRTATKDVKLRGKAIHEGDWVVLWYVSANRDEEVFPDPFRFDTDRWPNDHVTFGGGGPHFCLGANLARLELRLLFTELLTRMTDIEFDGEPQVQLSNFVGGIERMPIRWKVR